MARKRKKSTGKTFLALVTVIFFAVVAFLQNQGILPTTLNPYADGDVYLHIIDVGQGSATLIQQGNVGVLIDAGESDYGPRVSEYINSCGIDELKYVVASHPHSDHIGGLPYVLDDFEIGEFLMPEISEENIPTSRVYERLLDSLSELDISASYCYTGDVYTLGNITMTILGPVEQTDDLNNMSAVCRLSVGETDIMILGDAETFEIKGIYRLGGDFESEILLWGHHGSRTSLHSDFLAQVDPLEVVISCGKDNSYGHPHKETLNYLNKNNIGYCRTDVSGDIVYLIDPSGFERIEG